MADALEKHRYEAEGALGKLLAGLNRKARRSVKRALAEYGSIEAIPPEFWEALKREADEEAAAILLLLIVNIYQTENRRISRNAPSEARPALSGLRDESGLRGTASGLAAEMGRRLADIYVDGAKDRAAKRTADETTRAGKGRAIDDVFDDEQAGRTIATEVTRTITISQEAAGRDASGVSGLAMTVYWVTERDAKVCPICRPLHGKPQEEWERITAAGGHDAADFIAQGPPAHPNCRCSTRRAVRTGTN